MNDCFCCSAELVEMLTKMMLIRSIFVSFIVLEFPFSLCLPQGCSKCSRGPPQMPMYIRPDNTRYYHQNQQQSNIQSHSSKHPLRFLHGASNIFQELRERPSRHRIGGLTPHKRRTRDVSSDNPSLAHDINFKNDMIIPVRVMRHIENKERTELSQQNSTVAQDNKNTQDNSKKNEKEKMTNQRLPVVPVPRIKSAREQKIVAETLSEEVSIPTSGSQSPRLGGAELGEVVSGPSAPGIGKIMQLVDNLSAQPDVYGEPMDKMNAYYPIRRFAEFLQTPQNQVLIVPPGTRVVEAVGPQVGFGGLMNYPAYESDYVMEDCQSDSGTVAQIESPGTLEENSNLTVVQGEAKSELNNVNSGNKIGTELKEISTNDNQMTTKKP